MQVSREGLALIPGARWHLPACRTPTLGSRQGLDSPLASPEVLSRAALRLVATPARLAGGVRLGLGRGIGVEPGPFVEGPWASSPASRVSPCKPSDSLPSKAFFCGLGPCPALAESGSAEGPQTLNLSGCCVHLCSPWGYSGPGRGPADALGLCWPGPAVRPGSSWTAWALLPPLCCVCWSQPSSRARRPGAAWPREQTVPLGLEWSQGPSGCPGILPLLPVTGHPPRPEHCHHSCAAVDLVRAGARGWAQAGELTASLSPQTDPTAEPAGAASESQEQIRTDLQVSRVGALSSGLGDPEGLPLGLGAQRLVLKGPCCPPEPGRCRQWQAAWGVGDHGTWTCCRSSLLSTWSNLSQRAASPGWHQRLWWLEGPSLYLPGMPGGCAHWRCG